MTLSEHYNAAVAEYLKRLSYSNVQPKTVTNYEGVLRRFGDFISESGADDLYAALESWREHLMDSGAKPSTVKQYFTTLRIFFTKAAKRSFPEALRFDENPVDDDFNVKVPHRPYEIILEDAQVRMLYRNAPPNGRFANQWARNYAITMLLLNEKIRNAELLDLRLSDVDMSAHELTINNGKGRKFRVVDLSELSETALTMYLNSGLRPASLSDEDYLFGTTAPNEKAGGSRSGEKWHRGSGQWLSNVVERTVYAVTGVKNCRSHDLRHVGARVCLNAGESKEQLQGELGHTSLVTTEIYCSRMNARRGRESAKETLAARDKWAEINKRQIEAGQTVIKLFA